MSEIKYPYIKCNCLNPEMRLDIVDRIVKGEPTKHITITKCINCNQVTQKEPYTGKYKSTPIELDLTGIDKEGIERLTFGT